MVIEKPLSGLRIHDFNWRHSSFDVPDGFLPSVCPTFGGDSSLGAAGARPRAPMLAPLPHQQGGRVHQHFLRLEPLLPRASLRVRRPHWGLGGRRPRRSLHLVPQGQRPQAQYLRVLLVLEDQSAEDTADAERSTAVLRRQEHPL